MKKARKRPSPEFIQNLYSLLSDEFGVVETPLTYSQPHELAIAVILSAQCTDARVNEVTPELFKTFTSLESFAKAELVDIEKKIFSTGFYHNKAKNIQGFARMLVSKFGGVIPRTLEEAILLPGFGRKTANVVLSELYGISEGFVVDTHVKRLTKKIGLTEASDPVKIEREMMELIPKEYWRNLSLYLIFLGRKNCQARRTECSTCCLSKICPSYSVD
ncbi:endonuclease III domain-containing protein [Leptospira ilyithenensis]|uniref:Endonuclease III n=1 Tax=Leptospira ilyithenensis TaxID=2484901 RepID=A0A4R9LYB7_9LEPT|nr:endonuclease III [Leptospira ilyithenensis]TGN16775.1 endonuclease III [Leptospira ilyithenensis]